MEILYILAMLAAATSWWQLSGATCATSPLWWAAFPFGSPPGWSNVHWPKLIRDSEINKPLTLILTLWIFQCFSILFIIILYCTLINDEWGPCTESFCQSFTQRSFLESLQLCTNRGIKRQQHSTWMGMSSTNGSGSFGMTSVAEHGIFLYTAYEFDGIRFYELLTSISWLDQMSYLLRYRHPPWGFEGRSSLRRLPIQQLLANPESESTEALWWQGILHAILFESW